MFFTNQSHTRHIKPDTRACLVGQGLVVTTVPYHKVGLVRVFSRKFHEALRVTALAGNSIELWFRSRNDSTAAKVNISPKRARVSPTITELQKREKRHV